MHNEKQKPRLKNKRLFTFVTVLLTASFAFEFIPTALAAAPTVTSISPAIGVSTGGDSITITGTNFLAGNIGTGSDGAISMSGTKNINTFNIAAGRTCADGINYSVTALTANTATLSATPGGTCLGAGDEILLINLQGTGSKFANVGNYETLRVKSVSSNVVTFTSNKVKNYGDNAGGDTNIGTAGSNQRVMLQRVPNYTNVTLSSGSILTANAWDGTKGGVLFFRASGTLSNSGTIDASAKGYNGGVGAGGFGTGVQGESYTGAGTQSNSANSTGGGGGVRVIGLNSSSGGGGGYGTAGANGTANSNGDAAGIGGSTVGAGGLTQLFFGGGGGGANASSAGANGTAGGGIIGIFAGTITTTSGTITAGSVDAPAVNPPVGGGAGGSILLSGNTVTMGAGKVKAIGGLGSATGGGVIYPGGNGGDGRIAVYYGSRTGTTSPTYNANAFPTSSTALAPLITIGSNVVTNATLVNSTTITGYVPANSSGATVDVTVTNRDATSGSLTGGFTYYPPGSTVPDAPTITSATPGAGQVTLNWTAPSNTGGVSLTSYTIRYGVNDGTCTLSSGSGCTDITGVSASDTSRVIGSLTPGTSYKFTMYALNVIGTSPAATQTTATIATTPGTPTGLSATPGHGQVDLSWAAPSDNGGAAVTSYTVQYRTPSGSGSFTPLSPVSGTSTTVSGLTNGQSYDFQVAATNSVGTGSFTASATATPTYPAPTFSNISSPGGRAAGGETVTVTGDNFLSGAAVTFGGTAGSVTFTDSSHLSVVVPAHAAGDVDVAVTNPDTQSATSTNAYSYYDPPTVDSVSIPYSTPDGGESITINGSHFRSGAALTVGGVSVTAFYVNSGSITAATPAGFNVGDSLSVTVTNPGPDSQDGTLNDAITVYSTGPIEVPAPPGNGSSTFTLSSDQTQDITFNKPLNPVSKVAVEHAITSSASQSLTFGWNSKNTTVTVQNGTGSAVFPNNVYAVSLTDVFNITTENVLLLQSVTNAHQTEVAPAMSLTSSLTEAVINKNVDTTITIPQTVSAPTLNVKPLYYNGRAILPGAIQVDTSTSQGAAHVTIPAATTVTPSDTWDGTMKITNVLDSATAESLIVLDTGETASNVIAFSMGQNNNVLNFDQAVRLQFDGQAGKTVGYYENGTYSKITRVCADDTQTTNNILGAGNQCAIDVGPDLVVWTKHFTEFIMYDSGSGPIISGVDPVLANAAGGTTVVITGSNFSSSATVTFGGTAAVSYTVDNLTQITAEAPAHARGLVDIVVTNPGTLSDTLADALTYADVPGAPTSLALTAGNTQLGVNWSAPADNGGNAVSGYTVRYRTSPAGSWNTTAPVSGTSTAITGLTNGLAYDVEVAATNAIGTGSFSSTQTETPASSGGGSSENQTGNLTVNCPLPGTLSITSVPGDVFFSDNYGENGVTISSMNPKNAFDNRVNDGINPPLENVLQVDDFRTRGVTGCPDNNPGFFVTVQATDLTDGNGHSVSNASLRVITSNLIDTGILSGGFDTGTLQSHVTGEDLRYNQTSSGANAHDVTSPVLYDDAGRDDGVVNNRFRQVENYEKNCGTGESDCDGLPLSNTLNNPVTIMESSTSHNMSILTGVIILIDQGIGTNQFPASYSGTITYTLVQT